jgi:hypothetical protein
MSGDELCVNVQQEFWRRLKEEWLPAYCNDPARRYDIAGFRPDAKQVTDIDARDFLRALDQNVVSVDNGGRFRMPRSNVNEVIFWEHSALTTPRPITLWLEPVITIAAVARLHLDCGWPTECLGMQSEDSAFDVTAFKPHDLKNEYIAGEIKDSTKRLDKLLTHIKWCCAEGDSKCSAPNIRKNAHRKMVGLKRCRAPIFWALGPGGDSRVFDVLYNKDDTIDLMATDEEKLRFH